MDTESQPHQLDVKWFPKDHECPVNYLKFTYNGKPRGMRCFSKETALKFIDRAMRRAKDDSDSTRARLKKKIKRYKRIGEKQTLFDQYNKMILEYHHALAIIGRDVDPNSPVSTFSTIMSQVDDDNWYINFALDWAKELERKQKQAA